MGGDFKGQDKTVTIAKMHKCAYCGRLYDPGEKMRYQSGMRNSVFYSRYLCMRCWKRRAMVDKIKDFFKGKRG